MKMFSNCSGECCVCVNGSCCIAGHGDDDFSPASKEQIIRNLDKGFYPSYTDYMVKYLADKFGYDYKTCKVPIPVEWIKRWAMKSENTYNREQIFEMLNDWEKENEIV